MYFSSFVFYNQCQRHNLRHLLVFIKLIINNLKIKYLENFLESESTVKKTEKKDKNALKLTTVLCSHSL